MKIEECEVGMRVYHPNDGRMLGIIEDIDTQGETVLLSIGIRYASRLLSPAPDEQEEKIADSSASLEDVMDKLADRTISEELNTAMLARDEVPEETKQVLTREPKEIPWYSRITPMSERVKQV